MQRRTGHVLLAVRPKRKSRRGEDYGFLPNAFFASVRSLFTLTFMYCTYGVTAKLSACAGPTLHIANELTLH